MILARRTLTSNKFSGHARSPRNSRLRQRRPLPLPQIARACISVGLRSLITNNTTTTLHRPQQQDNQNTPQTSLFNPENYFLLIGWPDHLERCRFLIAFTYKVRADDPVHGCSLCPLQTAQIIDQANAPDPQGRPGRISRR